MRKLVKIVLGGSERLSFQISPIVSFTLFNTVLRCSSSLNCVWNANVSKCCISRTLSNIAKIVFLICEAATSN